MKVASAESLQALGFAVLAEVVCGVETTTPGKPAGQPRAQRGFPYSPVGGGHSRNASAPTPPPQPYLWVWTAGRRSCGHSAGERRTGSG